MLLAFFVVALIFGRACSRSEVETSSGFSRSIAALAEKVGEMFIVKGWETFAVVDGLANDKHGGKGEVIVMDYLR
jgi:hypothetical protein